MDGWMDGWMDCWIKELREIKMDGWIPGERCGHERVQGRGQSTNELLMNNTNPFSLISVSLQILFPGLWEVTLVDYYDTKGKLCNFVVSCTPPASVDEVIKLFETNFQKHYITNRAPFLMPLEPKWLQNNMYFEGWFYMYVWASLLLAGCMTDTQVGKDCQ